MVIVIVASGGLLAFAYAFNEVCDAQLGRSQGIHPDSAAVNRSVFYSIVPFAGGMILLTHFSQTVLALGLLFSLLWTAYSYPIPRLKAIPIVSTLVNGIGFPLLFLIGFASARTPSFESLLFYCLLVLLEIPAQLIHEACTG
jgi:4-hydroxybenzoate polyprenyltransferase